MEATDSGVYQIVCLWARSGAGTPHGRQQKPVRHSEVGRKEMVINDDDGYYLFVCLFVCLFENEKKTLGKSGWIL